MKRDPRDTWSAWREADDEGRLDEADRAFAELARPWTRSVVPPGLVARIAGLGASNRQKPAGIWELAWFRVAIGSVLAVTGMVLGSLSGKGLGGLVLASLQTVVAGVGSMLALVSAWGQAVGAVGTPVIRAVRAVGGVMTEPLPVLVLTMNVLLAAAAFSALRRLLGPVDGLR